MCPCNVVGGNMSGKTLEQRINMRFPVKTGKSASETALLTMAYGEYPVKIAKCFHGPEGSRKGRNMCKTAHEAGSHKRKGHRIVLYEFTAQGQTVNQECCLGVLVGLRGPVWR
jgi:hypothetical protein